MSRKLINMSRLQIGTRGYLVKLNQPTDISIPVVADGSGVSYFTLPDARVKPAQLAGFSGSIAGGASCNCDEISFIPHANGTHTEGVGHISLNPEPVHRLFQTGHFYAQLLSLQPEALSDDPYYPPAALTITRSQIEEVLLNDPVPEALIIRTLPNDPAKRSRNYALEQAPFLHYQAAAYLAQIGIEHLLVDFPSLDYAEGPLLSHMAYFQAPLDPHTGTRAVQLADVPDSPRTNASVTEFIFVPDYTNDGEYLLVLIPPGLPSDAAPSRPLLFPISAEDCE